MLKGFLNNEHINHKKYLSIDLSGGILLKPSFRLCMIIVRPVLPKIPVEGQIDSNICTKCQAYIQKGGSCGCRTPQTILNFPQKDCLRTRKVSRLHGLQSY